MTQDFYPGHIFFEKNQNISLVVENNCDLGILLTKISGLSQKQLGHIREETTTYTSVLPL